MSYQPVLKHCSYKEIGRAERTLLTQAPITSWMSLILAETNGFWRYDLDPGYTDR